VVKLLIVGLGGGTQNSGVNVGLVPVVKFNMNGSERRGGMLARGDKTAFRPVLGEFNHWPKIGV